MLEREREEQKKKKERGSEAVKNYPHTCVCGRNRNESMMKKAPARGNDKQQMQAPNMGEIKKHRSERWNVTTMGGGEKLHNRNGAEDWRKKETTMPL